MTDEHPNDPSVETATLALEHADRLAGEMSRDNDLREKQLKASRRLFYLLLGACFLFGLSMWQLRQDQNEDVDAAAEILRSIEETANDIQIVVDEVERQTSTEAQDQQQEQLNNVITIVDCNNAFRLQVVVNNLVEQGLIEPFTVQCEGEP